MEISREDLEALVDKKVEEKLSETDKVGNETSTDENKEYSRRDFLKSAALGAGGVGMLGLLPAASAFSIKSGNKFSFIGGGNEDFSVDTSGKMTVSTIDTDAITGSVTGGRTLDHLAGNVYVQSTEPSNPSDGDIWIDTS